MSDTYVAAPDAAGDYSPAPVTPAPEEGYTVSQAARMLSLRGQEKRKAAQAPAPEPSAELTATPEGDEGFVPDGTDGDPQLEAPAETTKEADPEEVPPVEPPRSWSKDAKERFSALPRDVQEFVAQREQERDREVRRTQNEAAEKAKAIEAERQKAEQARTEYEAKLPALMQILQSRGDFADVKTVEDVRKLQAEDPFRFQAWQVHQMELQAVNAELNAAQQRKAQEDQARRAKFIQDESARLLEAIPEFRDNAKYEAAQKKAADLLRNKGFEDSDLSTLVNENFIHDHRWQAIIYDAIRWNDAQAAKAKVAAKPNVPPVQRPGTARPANAAALEASQALQEKLAQSGRAEDAVALYMAQREARR